MFQENVVVCRTCEWLLELKDALRVGKHYYCDARCREGFKPGEPKMVHHNLMNEAQLVETYRIQVYRHRPTQLLQAI